MPRRQSPVHQWSYRIGYVELYARRKIFMAQRWRWKLSSAFRFPMRRIACATFANPWNTQRILRRFPSLKLTCDYSHWVCVAERLLPDCGEILQLSADHCWHLHARVGFEEGPQVPDPRAPEWSIIWKFTSNGGSRYGKRRRPRAAKFPRWLRNLGRRRTCILFRSRRRPSRI